ncbi:hypothetical protein [Sphaerisporangium sp. TRM90804]|uniref:hypothetical protein n=1 Tax=Sphaerisporangium sp. TRM90804 TaxID=3031113 RepID=UPI002449F548|nr:hypothetical protein [Sphaerisporangium sp. TRM90804]MDH2430006.1 hypothetical protein [Sphaerisporangium sp. TRM90804]
MSRLVLVFVMALGAAVAAPAARTSHADGTRAGDDTPGGGRVDVAVSRVECPSGRADIVMTAPRDHDAVEYTIRRGDTAVRDGILWPGVQRTIPVYLEPRENERLGVSIEGEGVSRFQVRSRCDTREVAHGEYREAVYSSSEGDDERDERAVRTHHYNPLWRHNPHNPLIREGRLPYTGPPADFYGKVATAVALVVFGGMLWFMALVWPGRVPAAPPGRRPPYARRSPAPPLA